ncbi:MAG: hypothetical protein ACE5FT_06845 [Candidatus Nanoarchaeia archaeon]
MKHTDPKYRRIATAQKAILGAFLTGATVLSGLFLKDIAKTYQNAGNYRGADKIDIDYSRYVSHKGYTKEGRALSIFEAAREEFNCRMASRLCVPPIANFQGVTLDDKPHVPANELEGTQVEGARGALDYRQNFEPVGVIYDPKGNVTVITKEGEDTGKSLGDIVRRCVSHRHGFTE